MATIREPASLCERRPYGQQFSDHDQIGFAAVLEPIRLIVDRDSSIEFDADFRWQASG